MSMQTLVLNLVKYTKPVFHQFSKYANGQLGLCILVARTRFDFKSGYTH